MSNDELVMLNHENLIKVIIRDNSNHYLYLLEVGHKLTLKYNLSNSPKN